MENERRRLELSDKLMQMGQALLKEGHNDKDYTVAQSGTIMILIGTLILSDEDMFIFAELCAMFSAKKLLDNQENIGPEEKKTFLKILQKMKDKEKTKFEQPKRRGGRKPKDTGGSDTK